MNPYKLSTMDWKDWLITLGLIYSGATTIILFIHSLKYIH